MMQSEPSAELTRFDALIRSRKLKPPADRPTSLADIERGRAELEAMQAKLPVPDDVRTETFRRGNVRLRWIDTDASSSARVVLYLHGGGYVRGSIDTHLELMQRTARAARARVLAVDYRLAPEHPYPAALEDAVLAYHWLLSQDIPAARIVVAGDSAGGGLALALLQKLRDDYVPMPAGAFVFSPWTDLTLSNDSVSALGERDPMVTLEGLRDSARHYANADARRAELEDPMLSPLLGSLHGLPPLHIQVGGNEILRDDSTLFCAKAKEAGSEAELYCWQHAFHVFQSIPSLPESRKAMEAVGEFVERVFLTSTNH